MPKISVVIPVYNKDKYLKKTIESVLNQDFIDFELILVDDGSTDDSAKLIKSFDDERIQYFYQENKGVSTARNSGVALSKSSLIAFLDADDFWYANHLSEIINLANTFLKADFFATAYGIQFSPKQLKEYVYPFEKQRVLVHKFYKYSVGVHLFFTSNFAVRKSIFNQLGGFSTNSWAEDTDLFIRLALHGTMAYSKSLTLIHINEAENSLFAKYSTDQKALLLKEFYQSEQKDADLKKYLDASRFAWIIEYKLSGQSAKAHKLLEQITTSNLNWKQKILIKLPGNFLRLLKRIQVFLRERSWYITPFS